MTGVSQIAVKDPTGTSVGNITLVGASPKVTINSPTGGISGIGLQTIAWAIQDPPASGFTSRILYSIDNGNNWSQIGEITNGTTLVVDFAALPGTSGLTALIRILVSDGVNTGSATSAPFSVAKKKPTAVSIDAPETGFSQPAADPIQLLGSAYDPDDGFLSGTQLQWGSNVQGALGTGSPLSVSLRPGPHTITLTATDSDGNKLTSTTDVFIGGAAPIVSVTTQPISTSNSANCFRATIGAKIRAGGAPLTLAQFSLDGGNTYASLPLNQLPYSFVVPGTGVIKLVATAYDSSGQSDAQSVWLTIPTACQDTPMITWPTPAAITDSTPLSSTQLDATAPVAGVFVYTPPTGTVLSAGFQTLSVVFTPTDNLDHLPASQSVRILVKHTTSAKLVVAPDGPISVGTALKLTAKITDLSGSGVASGDIVFCDLVVNIGCTGSAVLGTAQITSAGLAAITCAWELAPTRCRPFLQRNLLTQPLVLRRTHCR